MKKRTKSLMILIIMILVGNVFGQVEDLGIPQGLNGKVSQNVPYEYLPVFDLRQAIYEDSINDLNKVGPWRFGFLHEVSFSLSNTGNWTSLNNGARIWRLGITSINALSLNLIFDEFKMPEGGHVYLYAPNGDQILGAYTQKNHNPEYILGTEIITGDSLIIEYYEPANVLGQGELSIGYATHGYRSLKYYARNLKHSFERGFDDSGDCNYDALCTSFADPFTSSWDGPINSVAMIVSGGNGICSGALINNTCEDGTPYFLTADHCLGNSNAPSTLSWAFRFNWQDSSAVSCPGGNSMNPGNNYNQTQYGAQVRANNSNSDFALLEIQNMTQVDVQNYGAFYAGWDNSDSVMTNTGGQALAIGVHHPSGDIKKKCIFNGAPYKSFNAGAQVWWVDSWDQGVTEPGSSGSPLFDKNKRIIGQLYGGAAACNGNSNNGLHDYYGRFGVSWDDVTGANNNLESWLDGNNGACPSTGLTILDGFDPNAPTAPNDAELLSISPSGVICGASFITEVVLRNNGSNLLTSVTITYNIDGGISQTFNWSGNLMPAGIQLVTLPNISTTAGSHTITAVTTNPNNTIDTNPSNDSVSNVFNLKPDGQFVYLDLDLDCWGAEVSWEVLETSVNTVLFSGGPYINNAPNGVMGISDSFCLDTGCYTYIISDSYGDGMFGSQYGTCSVDGYYNITTINTDTILELTAPNANFGFADTNQFCVPPLSLQAKFNSNLKRGCLPLLVNFTDLSIGSPVSWNWSFPGGTPSNSLLQNPQNIQYNNPGIYPVSLTINDGSATNMLIYNTYLTVYDSLNVSITSAEPTCINSCDGIGSTTITGGSGGYTAVWSQVNPIDPNALCVGMYDVEIVDSIGCSASNTVFIDFSGSPLIANASVSSSTVYLSSGSTVNFVDSSINASSYIWDFGDGSTASIPNPSHTYTAIGSYNVSLIVSDGYCSDTITFLITVEEFNTVDDELFELLIYPNPSNNGTIYIRSNNYVGKTNLMLRDTRGRLLEKSLIDLGETATELNFDLPSGVYILNVQKEGINKTVKLIINSKRI